MVADEHGPQPAQVIQIQLGGDIKAAQAPGGAGGPKQMKAPYEERRWWNRSKSEPRQGIHSRGARIIRATAS